ncbi:MAG: hypothetical protein JSV54_05865 [Chloroflexota bacterium]|nr:MAG: hypothetical protein JSV54_05865 [Chloroflexota bacterium]
MEWEIVGIILLAVGVGITVKESLSRLAARKREPGKAGAKPYAAAKELKKRVK